MTSLKNLPIPFDNHKKLFWLIQRFRFYKNKQDRYSSILLILFSLLTTAVSFASQSQDADDFIEEIFEVKIPGFAGAYNASIIEYEEGYLMAFRTDACIPPIYLHFEDYYQYIGIIRLDENFQPKGSPYLCLGNRTYDPRLLDIDGTIYLIFASAGQTDCHSLMSSHLNMCTVHPATDAIVVQNVVELDAPCRQKWEKNWVPFVYKNKMHLAYTIVPHLVLRPSVLDGACEVVSNHYTYLHWPFGIIRGGTPALLVDGHYLAFFHSSISLNGTECMNYSIGAYTYSANPPFNILRSSVKPFSHPDFYSTERSIYTPSNVLFPGGFVVKDEKIYLCYGENDAVIKIMVLNKKALYKSLSP